MTTYFLDTSALVKRYVPEIGSTWVQQLTEPQLGNEVVVSRIIWVEVLSALSRRQREGSLTTIDRDLIIRKFRFELDNHYQVIELDQELIEAAGQLVIQYRLRTYDAIQLASVLRIKSTLFTIASSLLIFVTADNNLLALAQIEGLLVDNPNRYPE